MNTLYKYKSYSIQSIEMLANKQVYFADPAKLNDPFDCKIDIKGALEIATERAKIELNSALEAKLRLFSNKDSLYDKLIEDLSHMGILSLSRSCRNTLMWAHYANNHRGFCLGFNFSRNFIELNHENKIVGSHPVLYKKENPFIGLFKEFAELSPPFTDFWLYALSHGAVTKSIAWKYEQEVRIIKKEPGIVSFNPNELSEVIFGLNMPIENREFLKHLLRDPEWKHVKFKEIFKASDFRLRLRSVK